MHVAVIGDFDRGDQALNVRKLQSLFAPLLQHCGVECLAFTTQINEEKEISNWLPYWKSAILSNEVNWPSELKLSNLCVIGFEVRKKYLEFLSLNRVPWVNLAIHPLRFLDDLYFDVTTSFEFNLIEGAASEGLILQSASILRQRFPISASKLECSRLAIIGQTPIDKSVFFEGRFFNLLDYLPKIDKIAKKYKTVIYKPHPLLSDIDVDAKIVERYQAETIGVKDTYEWLIRGEISEICGISSSLIHEAPFFNIKSTFLDKRASSFGPPISYKWLVENTQFWAEGLLGLSKVSRSQTHISSVTPKNFLRNTFGAWGYTRIDEDALKSNIDHLSWRLDNTIVTIEAEKNRADSLATERGQLAERVTALESERSTLDSRLSTLTAERDSLATERDALAARHSTLASDHEALHQANHGHWQLAESLKQELAAKEQTWSEERSTLDSRLSSLSSEHSSLVTSHSSLIAERDALATERNTLLAERSTLDSRLSTLTAERDALATHHQLLATERVALSSRIEEVAGEAAVARAQSESLRQELMAKDESLASMRETLAAERSAAELRLSTLDSRLSTLTAERNELTTRHQLLFTERAALAGRIEEVAGEAAVARAQSEGLRQELAANEQAWSEERSSLDSRLSTLTAERDTLATSHSLLATEREALSSRLSTLVTEHEALHQANHGHWQLAESLKQELAAKEQAWSEERSTLDARLSTLVAERDTLLASTCWRITAPIRWMRGGVRIPWPAPNEPLDDFFLKHAALYIRRRPHLKERALQFLFRNPKWHARVLPVLQGIKASTASPIAFQPIPQPLQLPQPVPQPASLHEISPLQEPVAPVTAAPSAPLAPPIDLASLTPHARRIYADLKKAIEKKKGEVRA